VAGLTLEKLFSTTVSSYVEWGEEVVTVQWAPARWTGEMDDLAEALSEEEDRERAEVARLRENGDTAAADKMAQKLQRQDRRNVRKILATIIVTWDLLDGVEPFPTDEEHLAKLPDAFNEAVFKAITEGNHVDPRKARDSGDTSAPTASSAKSRRGTRSSEGRTSSESPRGK
jgi:hypothetical protein